MKSLITLLCLTMCIFLNAAQMARILTQEQQEAAQLMFKLIYENKIDDLKALLLKHPEIVNEMPTVNFAYETEDSQGTRGWGTNVKSALHYAIEIDNHEALCILLEYNANPDIQNRQGSTALIWKESLAKHTTYALTQTLIEAGANKEIRTTSNKTALDIAKYGPTSNLRNYRQTIADGEAERYRYALEKQAALDEIQNFVTVKDLTAIICGYAYGVLPRDLPKVCEEKKEKKGWFATYCTIQ